MSDEDLLRRVKDLEDRVDNLETIEYSKIYFTVLNNTTGKQWSTALTRSSADDGLIDLSSAFGVPANVQAVIVRLFMHDSDASPPVALCKMGPSSPAGEAFFYASPAYTDEWIPYTTFVSCDANGDIYISFSESIDGLYFDIIGYVI